MKAKFFMGPKDGAEEDVQTSNGFAPELWQNIPDPIHAKSSKNVIAYYDLQEVKEGVAYYKYRCTA
jgi:hypothetical protein